MDSKMLVCEDEPLLLVMIEEIVKDLGFDPLMPSTYAGCLEAAREGDIQAALVDVKLWGEKSIGIVDELKHRDIPYVIMSGYSAAEVTEIFGDAHIITKPFDITAVETVFGQAFPAGTEMKQA